MYCDFCGKKITEKNDFCDQCGGKLNFGRPFFGFIKNIDFKKYYSHFNRIKKEHYLILFAIVVIAGIGFLSYRGYMKEHKQLSDALRQQEEQGRLLNEQVNEIKNQSKFIQEQSASSTRALFDELKSQKAQTENAQRQAQLAQSALDLIKNQPTETVAVNTNNNFPTINSAAIVLIVCFDNQGNAQTGSGTIISGGGHVLTNKHVVTDNYGNLLTCGALMNNGNVSSPKIETNIFYILSGSLPDTGLYTGRDAALLKIVKAKDIQTEANIAIPASFPYILLQSGNLKQGDTLYIFGYPAASDFIFNATRGIVSSFSSDNNFINTDAIIDRGNSGGAAITSDGRFVGIPTAKYVANGDYLGQILKIDFLIP